jgi:hypothetical protein
LPELRAAKTVNEGALAELLLLTDELSQHRDEIESLSRVLAGKLWFVFSAMLTEAEHARDPESILDAAWNYQENLRRFFGPSF